MVHIVIYCMRGWIAFVAFIEFSNAIRCFYDEKTFIRGNLLPSSDENEEVIQIFARLLGRHCLLNGTIMTHCALFIQHIPLISLSIISLILSILHYGSEAFYYYTMVPSFYVAFPILISFTTIICLTIAPVFIEDEPKPKKSRVYEEEEEDDDEDYESVIIKKRASQSQNNLASKMKKMQ